LNGGQRKPKEILKWTPDCHLPVGVCDDEQFVAEK
jgi:hypothetical protein